MRQFRLLLRITMLAMVINGMSQALITYAVNPGKYENPSYTNEEVKQIAYEERSKGVQFLYERSAVNAMAFTILGVLAAIEMWLSNQIELLSEQTASESNSQADSGIFSGIRTHWPLVVAVFFAMATLVLIGG